MTSLPVPLEADNGTFGSAFEVGTEVHLGVFVKGNAGVSLSRAEPRLSSTSAPAAVGVSVCRLGQRGYIGSATGPLPPGTCESLTRFKGQRLGPHDYLIVTIVPLGAGTIDVELVATANDGIRTGTSRIDLSLVEAERS